MKNTLILYNSLSENQNILEAHNDNKTRKNEKVF